MFRHSEDDKKCGNCKHFDHNNMVYVSSYDERGNVTIFKGASCMVRAVEPDAGTRSVVIQDHDGNCINHSGMWEPSKDLLDEQEADGVQFDCTAGVDYPATLGR